jgi:hypothetical protein
MILRIRTSCASAEISSYIVRSHPVAQGFQHTIQCSRYVVTADSPAAPLEGPKFRPVRTM